MKKILAIASASSLFLVGCGSSEPNYDAVLSKIEKTSTVPLTQEERDEWPEFADLTCMHIQQSGKEQTAHMFLIVFSTEFEDAMDLVDSLDENVCSKL